MSETIEKTETIELGEKELAEITAKVNEGLDIKKTVEDVVKESTTEAVSKAIADYVEKTEEVAKKNVAGGEVETDDQIAKGLEDGLFNENIVKESKEMRLAKAVQAFKNGDMGLVKQYNSYANIVAKADYGNETVDADGGYLVPDPDFDTQVYENLPNYGVALANADVRRVNGNSVRLVSMSSGVEMYSTAEAGVKTGAKLTFSGQTVDLVKYAVIIPATDELTEDAAIDFWATARKEVSRAYAKKLDETVFTNATTGITNTSGVITEPVSGAGTTITWDDLLTAEGKGEDDMDTSNAAWYMRKETYFRLLMTKGTTNDHYLAGSINTNFNFSAVNPTTPWGTPVRFTRVLPKSTEVGSNDAFAVYGDLSNYKLYIKNGLVMEVFNAGVVKDAGGSDFNLITQDGKALRAVARFLGVLPAGVAGRFVILGTGTVS